MPPTIRDLSNRFTYHPPTEAQQLKYTEIRGRALDFAERLVQLVPGSPELSTALTKLDELVMHANAGIARNSEQAEVPSCADDPAWSGLAEAQSKAKAQSKAQSKAKPSIEVQVQSNSQGAAAFATDLVSLLQRVQSWRNGGGTGIYSPHLRDDFPDDLREGIATTLLEAAGRRAGGGTSAFPTDLVNLLQRVKEWRGGSGDDTFPDDLREKIAITLGAAGDIKSQEAPEADPEATTVKTEPQTDLINLLQRVYHQLVYNHAFPQNLREEIATEIATTLQAAGDKASHVDPEATTVKTEPHRDLAAEIAAEDAAMDLLQRVKKWRDGDDNDAFPHDLRDDIWTALPKFRTDAFSLLQRVKSWREGYDSHDCFPHDLREDIADVLRASADTAVDAPVPLDR